MSRKNRNILILYAKKIISELSSYCLCNENTSIINDNNKEQYLSILKQIFKAISLESKNLYQIKKYDYDDIDRFEDLMDLLQKKYPNIALNYYSSKISFKIDDIKYELKCYLK